MQVFELEDDELSWVWAYSDHLKWLDEFDAEYIHLCSLDSWTVEQRRNFKVRYGVNQGKAHANLDVRDDALWRTFHDLARQPFEGDVTCDKLLQRWEELNSLMGATRGNQSFQVWVIASKFLWFHHPRDAVMFDKNAWKAVRARCNRGRIARADHKIEYLKGVDRLCAQYEGQIDRASHRLGRVSPFKKRVVDKWLWLEGSCNKSTILTNYRRGWRLAPALVTGCN